MTDLERPHDAHMQAIGEIVAGWARIEFLYHSFIGMLIPDRSVALRVYELLGNESRWALLKDELPAHLRSDAERSGLEFFLKAAAICKENRNAIAHSEYLIGNKPDTIIAYRGRSRDLKRQRFHEVPLAALHEIRTEIDATARYGGYLWAALHSKPGEPFSALPEKPPQPRKWDLRSPLIPEDDPLPPPPSRE